MSCLCWIIIINNNDDDDTPHSLHSFSFTAVSIQTQSLALRALRKQKPQEMFLAVFVYATHAMQVIAFEWKPGLTCVRREGWLSDQPVCVKIILQNIFLQTITRYKYYLYQYLSTFYEFKVKLVLSGFIWNTQYIRWTVC